MSWEDDDFEPQVPKRTAQVGFSDEDEDDDDAKEAWDASSEEEGEGTPATKATTPDPSGAAAAPQKKKSLKQALKEKEQGAGMADEMGLTVKKAPPRQKAGGEFAAITPQSKEDFAELAKLVAKRLSSLESSPFYSFTIETILREATTNSSADDVKRIVAMLNTLANDKQKAEKGKVKPKKGKAALKVEARGDKDYTEGDVDDYDDF